MTSRRLPLLLFPQPTSSEREKRPPSFFQTHFPEIGRQSERLTPKFNTLQTAFDARRVLVQAATPNDDPELVVVFETVGSVDNFVNAVRNTPGLEWLLESSETDIAPDEDFYAPDDRNKYLSGRLFLIGSNRQALEDIISLWNRYKANTSVTLERGLAPWKSVFAHLKDVRFWGAQDRVGQDVRQYWEDKLAHGDDVVRFEIEAWCFASPDKNTLSAEEISRLATTLGGRIISNALLTEIAYHGFLIEMPSAGIRQLMSDTPPGLVLSDHVMFFRPRGQAIAQPGEDDVLLPSTDVPTQSATGSPVIAVLDGLPQQNHPLLAGRIIVDDPDDWAESYEAKDRSHGTAMASLIVLGELDGMRAPISRPIYMRPILRPNPTDFRPHREEVTPSDTLLIDIVHRSVRRIFEGEGDSRAAAPSIKVINLSVGDQHRQFDSELSPWARLIDWLSNKYRVLFIVSAGNVAPELLINTPRESLFTLAPDVQQNLALNTLLSDSMNRRLLSPAESVNALTVGAAHTDGATFRQVPNRHNLFVERGVSPYSCIGHGYRRAIKPDILLPGGRVLLREKLNGPQETTSLELVKASAAPGHRVAAPPNASGDNTRYERGTSNAAALASRGAAQAYEVIETLRAGNADLLPTKYDAVILKALLAHGAEWGDLENQITNARQDITDSWEKKKLITRFVGYGLSDIDKALTCTEQRATLIGVGELKDGEALEFRAPLPPCLNARVIKRKLTITLAWLSPVSPRNARYRIARLWIKPPHAELHANRLNCDWQQVRQGTLQHEVCEGDDAMAFVDGQELVFKINCAADAGKITQPIEFALCASLEVAEGIEAPIYQEIRERVQTRVVVRS